MQKSDYLRALLSPASVALVGASAKPGSMGRIVLENLIDGGYEGALHLVNPSHRRVLARRSHASLGGGKASRPCTDRRGAVPDVSGRGARGCELR
jgi:acyl-CoA synthetase (NDP forming)